MNEMDTRFANQFNIQWFPGHMTKTLRMMEQEIQHVDASLVLLDARIPLSSLNPEIERITDRKPKLYALNKADLADPAVTEEWIRYFHAADAGCVAISAKQKGGANAVKVAIEKELSGLLERRQNRERKYPQFFILSLIFNMQITSSSIPKQDFPSDSFYYIINHVRKI